MSNNYLIIFIRYPETGKVKTRLSKSIGSESATTLYRLFVEAVLNRTSFNTPSSQKDHEHSSSNDTRYETAVFFTPEEKRSNIKDWLGDKYRLYHQSGNDLGERMSNAFKKIYDVGAKKVVIIGSDTPTLKKRLIFQAFELLDKNDVVIGPTKDGGYYLLGLSFISNPFKKYQEDEIFTEIEWSTEKVFNQTITKVKNSGYSYKPLPEYYDIDTIEDLYLLKQEISQTKDIKSEHLGEINRQLEILKIKNCISIKKDLDLRGLKCKT